MPLRKLYSKWMFRWETKLTTRDTNRVERPFEWGLDWMHGWPFVNGHQPQASEIENYVHKLNDKIVAESDTFFDYKTPTDFRLENRKVERFHTGSGPAPKEKKITHADFLRFTSPVVTPYPENNLVNARWFPPNPKKMKPGQKKRAVIVLPQWNSDAISHNALCGAFSYFGIASLRLSMPYHDIRMPAELKRADYAVSANVGRTIDATRQAIVDIRCCLDWLEQQGYEEFGILGTSLGSCYAFLASAHDDRIKVNVFNHASIYFADVVWTGQSTRHIRSGIEKQIPLESLRQAWLSISPVSYFEKFAAKQKKILLIYAKYDLTFLEEFSVKVAEAFKERRLDHKTVVLPCGHYTTGETPYKYMDGYHIVNFIARAF
jgi:dienelactone hydrolase